MTAIRQIATDTAPAAIGPYSQAVIAGDTVYVSGQIPLDPASGQMVADDIDTQTRRVLDNLAAVLTAAGSGLDRVVRCDVFLADMGDFATMNTIYASYFDGPIPPARQTIQAARLPKDCRVEIGCIALLR